MEHAWEFACRSASATPATKYDFNQRCNGLETLDLISLAGATTAMAEMMEHCMCVCVVMGNCLCIMGLNKSSNLMKEVSIIVK